MMKVTTPKEKEFLSVEEIVTLLEEQLDEATNGQNEYKLYIKSAISAQYCMSIRDIYIKAGWKDMKYSMPHKGDDNRTQTIFNLQRV